MEKTFLTKKGVDFPKNAEINVDNNGKLYYKENSCEKNYFNKNPKIKVGTVETLKSNENSYVTQSGDKENVILNFGLTSGDTGDTGPQGEKGEKGEKGNETIIVFSGSKGIITTSEMKNKANSVLIASFSYVTVIETNQTINQQISKSSIGDILITTIPLSEYTNIITSIPLTLIHKNSILTYSNFSVKSSKPAFVENGVTATLILRFYIASPPYVSYIPLSGTSTDIILSDSIINGTTGIFQGNTGDISIPIKKGDSIVPFLFLVNNSDVETPSTFYCSISGGITLK